MKDAKTLGHTWGAIRLSGSSKGFRIDNNNFFNLTTRGVTITCKDQGNCVTGVIDHNVFAAPYNLSVQSVSVIGSGDVSWNTPQYLGAEQAVYAEDNTFNYDYPNDGALDAYGGARKVNLLDFNLFKNAFKAIFNSIFDLNSDNTIDIRDLGVLMSGWLP